MIIRAFGWYHVARGADRPFPPPTAAKLMVAEIAAQVDGTILRPVSLACLAWPPAAFEKCRHDHLACIAITFEPGEMTRSLGSWFQWQHPRWGWAQAPAPMIEHVAAPAMLPPTSPVADARAS